MRSVRVLWIRAQQVRSINGKARPRVLLERLADYEIFLFKSKKVIVSRRFSLSMALSCRISKFWYGIRFFNYHAFSIQFIIHLRNQLPLVILNWETGRNILSYKSQDNVFHVYFILEYNFFIHSYYGLLVVISKLEFKAKLKEKKLKVLKIKKTREKNAKKLTAIMFVWKRIIFLNP